MSKVVDQKIVEMQFDNEKFEKNVGESMSSIDKLKEKLNFENSGQKAFDNISESAKKVNLDSLINSTNKATNAFEKLEAAATIALGGIMKDAIEAGAKMIDDLTIKQITSGWQKYADKTSSIATILSATKDQGETIESVTAQMERLSWFTDETSYNFTDMVSNIGKFTANQIPLEEAVTSMEGIATWAALSGQNAGAASRAMYNLSQALGAGAVKLIDWKSIENANMATSEFKQTAIDTAVALGTLTQVGNGLYETINGNEVSVKNFNSALKDGWFDAEVLNATLNKYGAFSDELYDSIQTLNDSAEGVDVSATTLLRAIDTYDGSAESLASIARGQGVSVDILQDVINNLSDETLEFGRKAFEAAQEARTFKDAIDAVKDAVSSRWMEIFDIIFGNYEQAKVLWTDLANYLYEIFTADLWAFEDLLSEWNLLGGRDELFRGVYALFDNFKAILDTIRESLSTVFPMSAERLVEITTKFADWAEEIMLSDEKLQRLKDTLDGIFSIIKIGFNIVKTVMDFVSPILSNIIMPVARGLLDIIFAITGGIGTVITKVQEATTKFSGLNGAIELWQSILGTAKTYIVEVFDTIASVIDNIFSVIFEQVDRIKAIGFSAWFDEILEKLRQSSSFGATIAGWIQSIIKFFDELGNKIRPVLDDVLEFFRKLKSYNLDDLRAKFAEISPSTARLVARIDDVIASFKRLIDIVKNSKLAQDIKELFTRSGDEVKGSGFLSIVADVLNIFLDLASVIYNVLKPAFQGFWDIISTTTTELVGFIKEVFGGINVDTLIGGGIAGALITIALKIKDAVNGFTGFKDGILKILDSIKNMFVAWQNSIKADTIKKIAEAVAILAASIIALALIDEDALMRGVSIVTLAISGLVLALKLLIPVLSDGYRSIKETFIKGIGAALKNSINFVSITTGLIQIAAALVIFAIAIKKLGDMDPEALNRGLHAVVVTLIELLSFTGLVQLIKIDSKMITGVSVALIELGAAIYLLSMSVKKMGNMDETVLIQGMAATFFGLVEMMVAVSVLANTCNNKDITKVQVSMVLFGAALAEISIVAGMMTLVPWESLGKAGASLAGLTLILGVFSRLFTGKEKDFKSMNSSIILFATALDILSVGIAIMGTVEVDSLYAIIDVISMFVIGLVGLEASFVGIAGIIDHFDLEFSFLALGRSIEMMGIGAGAAGVGVLAFALALKTLAEDAEYVPKAMEAIGAGIASLAQSLLGAMDDIVAAIAALIVGVIEHVLDGIANLVESIVTTGLTIILTALRGISDNLDEIVDLVIDIIIRVLNKVGEKAQVIVDAAMQLIEGIFKALGSHLGQLNILDAFAIEAFIASMGLLIKGLAMLKDDVKNAVLAATMIVLLSGLMAAIMALLSNLNSDAVITNVSMFLIFVDNMALVLAGFAKLNINMGAAIEAAKAIVVGSAIIIGGIAAIALILEGIFGLLALIPDVQEFFNNGIELLVTVFDGLGRAFGAIVAGFMGEVAAAIPGIGTALSDFMTNASGFFEKLDMLSPEKIESAKTLAEVVTEISSDAIINGIASWLGIDTSANFSTLSEQLVSFGTTIVDFSESIKDLDDGAVDKTQKAADAALALAMFAEHVPKTGGIWQDIAGVHDLADFGNKIETFVNSLISVIETLEEEEFGQSEIDLMGQAAQAGTKMTDLAQSIPKEGLLQLVTGMQDLSGFGLKMESYITALKMSVDKLKEANFSSTDVTRFDYAAQAGQKLVVLLDSIPEKGLLNNWASQNTIYDFANKVKAFIDGLSQICQKINDENFINPTNMSRLNTTITSGHEIIDLINAIPETVTDGSDIKTGLTNVGEGLCSFAEKTSEIDQNQVAKAVENVAGLIPTLTEISNINLTGFDSFASAMQTLSDIMSGNFITAFTNQIPSILQIVQLLLLKIVDILALLPQKFVEYAYDSCVKMIATYEYCIPGVNDSGRKIAEAIYKGISTIETKIPEIPKSVAISLVNGFNSDSVKTAIHNALYNLTTYAAGQISNYSGFYSTGQWTILGFIDGLKSREWQVATVASALGTTALHYLNIATKVSSPSKLAMESGEYFGEGYAIGISSQMKNVGSVADEMGNNALDSLAYVLSTLSTVLDSDMDLSPTITPVLDLSEIQNGIGLVNGYLANGSYSIGSVSGLMARNLSVGSINSGIANTYNDANVLTAIDELTSRVDSLNDSLTNMQIVLDSGQLVGGLSDKMNSRFGQMEYEAGRGIR